MIDVHCKYIIPSLLGVINTNKYDDIIKLVEEKTIMKLGDFYLEQNGKIIYADSEIDPTHNIYCHFRMVGGKGGFGSMLRAIGAQIEKTTNREACRDLSGRRLRDINEEKRLKSWLEKQGEREREAEERKKRKIEKLLAQPKHDFKDDKYEETRSKLTEKVNDAVEEGFKKDEEARKKEKNVSTANNLKRKIAVTSTVTKNEKKKKLPACFLDDMSSDDSSDDESNSDAASVGKQEVKNSSV